MSQPTPLGLVSEVPFYLVVAPGKDPSFIHVTPVIHKLTWNFGQMDRGELIDLAEEVDTHMSTLEKWLKAAREVLKQTLEKPSAEKPEVVVAGRKFEAHYTYSVRHALDQEKVKSFLGTDYPNYVKATPVYTLKITAITQTPGVEV